MIYRPDHTDNDRDLLIRYLDRELSAEEASKLSARLEAEPALKVRLERLEGLQSALRASRAPSFSPFFSERVLRRLVPAASANGAQALYESLRWLFARTAVVSLVAAAALGAYNMMAYQDIGVVSSIAEAVLGLPSTSLMDALSYPAL